MEGSGSVHSWCLLENDGGPSPPSPVYPEEAQLQRELLGGPGLWSAGRQERGQASRRPWRHSPPGAPSTAPTPRTPGWPCDSYFGKSAPAAPVLPKTALQQLKRQRAESSTSYESGSESGQPVPALSSFRTSSSQPNLHGFSRGGSWGFGSGNPFPRGYKRGGFDRGRGSRGKWAAFIVTTPHPTLSSILVLLFLLILKPLIV